MPQSVFRARRFILSGDSAITEAVNHLIGISQWFVVMPLPDSEWRLIVKMENGAALEEYIKDFSLSLVEDPTDIVYSEDWALREEQAA